MTARRISRWARPLSLLPAAGWYAVIWRFSAQPASVSGSLSDGLLYRLMRLCSPAFAAAPEDVRVTAVESLSFFERKAAHMFLYFVLALLASFAACFFLRRLTARAGAAAALCGLLAALDEYHQTLVPGRSGEVRDVLVDLSGAAIALAFLALPQLARWCRRNLRHPLAAAVAPAAVCLLCLGLALAPAPFHEAAPLARWTAARYLPGASPEALAALLAALAPVLRDMAFLVLCGLAGVCLPLTALLAGPRWPSVAGLWGAAVVGAGALAWAGRAAAPLPAGVLALLGGLGIGALWAIAGAMAAIRRL